ncbi:phage integrase Arm DNA-binding domain-containing protein [Spartinivicinus ruber]|uniref:phage integrase Arm DNA-binding domain-containing protein n=1 Tax=Spartinivicinus ruber TaxID=2683272 RepID=UPI0013D7C272|nr:phage integrase Arm DNA-binding domain-containing protein [Spartinivicinus ruber]
MAPRKKTTTKSLEPNLYTYGPGNKYYRYKHPVTGKFFAMGTDRRKAQAAARMLNARLMKGAGLVETVMGMNTATVSQAIERFQEEYLPTRHLKPGSLDNMEQRLRRLNSDLGKMPLRQLDVPTVADYLDENFERDSYVQHRSVLNQVLRFAVTKGLMKENPVPTTINKKRVKQRKRLTLVQFKTIYQQAKPWLKIALELALITLQRRGDLVELQYKNIKDGKLFLIQQKTEKWGDAAYLAIELSPKLQALIHLTKQSGLDSPFIIHRKPHHKSSCHIRNKHWTYVTGDTLSREFSKVRDSLDEFKGMPAASKPTFHEIRALGGYLYEKHGFPKDYIRALMGHTEEYMTNHYLEGHTERWTHVSAELNIDLLKDNNQNNNETKTPSEI